MKRMIENCLLVVVEGVVSEILTETFAKASTVGAPSECELLAVRYGNINGIHVGEVLECMCK